MFILGHINIEFRGSSFKKSIKMIQIYFLSNSVSSSQQFKYILLIKLCL